MDSVLIIAMTSLENFRLTVFRKVAAQLSFRKAAEDLYLTQPAVSLQIKALEEELGVALFDRSGFQVGLTPAGKALLGYAGESSRLLREARNAVASFSGAQTGALTLGASTTIAQYVLPRLLSEFCTTHPRVSPTLISGNTEEIVSATEDKKLALGFIEGPPRSRDLTLTPFLEDELVLLTPAAHEWAERTEITPDELARMPLLMRERGSGTRHIVELALERNHIRRSSLNVVMELDSTEAIKSAVEAGFGVGFVSRWAIAKDLRFGSAFRIVEIKGIRFRRHFVLISRKAPALSGPAAEFHNYVLETTMVKGASKIKSGKPAKDR
ncbi:MAG: LysR family transcriptional regulator [Terracidiphilus sp.]|jgi:DNA-binding transcriptional LysR family regulator